MFAPANHLEKFPSHKTGEGSPGATQHSPRVQEIELGIWEGQSGKRSQGREHIEQQRKNSRDLQSPI